MSATSKPANNVVPMRAVRTVDAINDEFVALAKLAEARRAAFPNLKAKLAWIQGQLDRVPKNGFNAEHKYHFARESDLVDALREVLYEANVSYSFAPIMENLRIEEFTSKSGGKGTDAFVDLVLTIINGDEPYDEHRAVYPGQGRDWSDKAIPKALTSAKKYAMILAFAMSSGDDIENASRGDSDPKVERTELAPIDQETLAHINRLFLEKLFSDERKKKACGFASANRVTTPDKLYMIEGVRLLAHLKKAAAEPTPQTTESEEIVYCVSCGAQQSPASKREPHFDGCEDHEDDAE